MRSCCACSHHGRGQTRRARRGVQVKYPVSAINILKAHGKSARESRLLDGYALNMGRAAQVRGARF